MRLSLFFLGNTFIKNCLQCGIQKVTRHKILYPNIMTKAPVSDTGSWSAGPSMGIARYGLTLSTVGEYLGMI
jgi:hypothetical protein